MKNPADCEVRGVIRFLQADEILGYLAEEARSRVELFCCTRMYARILPGRDNALLREQFQWDIFEHPPYSPDLAPSDFFLYFQLLLPLHYYACALLVSLTKVIRSPALTVFYLSSTERYRWDASLSCFC